MTGRLARTVVFARDPMGTTLDRHGAAIDAAEAATPARAWHPGRALRVLLAGYTGASNVGADVRSSELARQLRAVLGSDQVEFGIVATRDQVPAELGAASVEVRDGDPAEFVSETTDAYDAVVISEGSVFTSTFSDELAALFAAFLGYARAQGKLSVAVGADADRMNADVAAFVEQRCRDAVVFARSDASRRRLAALGLDVRTGSDTGWTYVPSPATPAHELLCDLGWDGESDPLVLCPTNPFWWPLELDVRRALLLRRAGPDPNHYGGYAFHRSSETIDRSFERYLDSLAAGVDAHRQRHTVFPVVVGMEPLDRAACAGLAARLGAPEPLLAGDHESDAIVGVLRAAARIVSTRLHAIILSMSAGVPSIGVKFDARIPALMQTAGLDALVLDARDEALARRLAERLDRVATERASIGGAVRAAAARQLRRQGEMGLALRREFAQHHPGLALPDVAPGWRGGLPALHPDLGRLAAEADGMHASK